MRLLKRAKFKTYMGLLILLLFLILSSAIVQAQTADEYDGQIAFAWFNLQLKLVRETPGYTPPVASRAFGYTGITLYEAVVAGVPEYQSLVGQLNELTELPQPESDAVYHWGIVANSALAEISRLLFATATEKNLAAIEELYQTSATEFEGTVDADVLERSAEYGQAIANAIFTWSMTDGGHEGYRTNFPTDYAAPTGDGLWIPTPRSNGEPLSAMQPYWGENRPFVLESGAACMPDAPPEFSEEPESAFYVEAQEVYATSQTLTEDQRVIALFWADDPGQTATPPGHSISILTQVLQQEAASLALAAEAYARMGIAVADAFIGCWNTKFVYNLARPVTVIQEWMQPDWMPMVNTPPFPEFPSGHSVQTAAAAVVLADLFGDEYTFTDHTHDERDMAARTFTSFSAMAEETAMSRLYAGIHYRSAIALGLEQGRCIGAQVNKLQFLRDG
jgi:membrane-associated phospholipid phosphatase